jgi:hypothetical protein
MMDNNKKTLPPSSRPRKNDYELLIEEQDKAFWGRKNINNQLVHLFLSTFVTGIAKDVTFSVLQLMDVAEYQDDTTDDPFNEWIPFHMKGVMTHLVQDQGADCSKRAPYILSRNCHDF